MTVSFPQVECNNAVLLFPGQALFPLAFTVPVCLLLTPEQPLSILNAMKSVCVLGATGSIGRQTLDIIAAFPERFQVSALTAHASVALLAEQAIAALVENPQSSNTREAPTSTTSEFPRLPLPKDAKRISWTD